MPHDLEQICQQIIDGYAAINAAGGSRKNQHAIGEGPVYDAGSALDDLLNEHGHDIATALLRALRVERAMETHKMTVKHVDHAMPHDCWHANAKVAGKFIPWEGTNAAHAFDVVLALTAKLEPTP